MIKWSWEKNHPYYAQIQGLLAITNRQWCHFLIYTNAGQHVETVYCDDEYWNNLEKNLTWFYVNRLAPAAKNKLL